MPLSTSRGGLSSSDSRPGMGPQTALLFLTGAEGHHPGTGLGGVTPVQRHRQSLGLDVDPDGRLGLGPGRHRRHHGLPRPSVGPHVAQPVQTDEPDPGRGAQDVVEEVHRPARDHGDQSEAGRQANQERQGTPGHGTGVGRVVDDGRQRPVEVEAERAVAGVSGEGKEDLGQRTHHGREATCRPEQPGRHPMTTTTSSPTGGGHRNRGGQTGGRPPA